MIELKIAEEYTKIVRKLADRNVINPVSEDDCRHLGQIMADKHLKRIYGLLDKASRGFSSMSEATLLPYYTLDEYLNMLNELGTIKRDDNNFKLTKKGKDYLRTIGFIEFFFCWEVLYDNNAPGWKKFLALFSDTYAKKFAKNYLDKQ